MSATVEQILISLQHADSFFPSGAIAFSWGLETLVADHIVRDAATLENFVRGQLLYRWASFDRAFIVAAMKADPQRLYSLDREVDCLELAKEQREGSIRAGRSLLAVHARLGTPGAAALRSAIAERQALGHLPVAQGAVFAGLGLDPQMGQAASAYGLTVGAASTAVRLGVVGAIEAQKVIAAVRPIIAKTISLATPNVDHAWVYVPQTEIAIMRHESQSGRLFAN
jgi:urease accessory protein